MRTARGPAWPPSKETSSRTVSRTVARRRAPMFSVAPLTSIAKRAISRTASSVKDTSTPSVARRAWYCFRRALRGSVRIRTRSSRVRLSNSTRIGKRPCSSGMRSDGLATWNAPAATKRM